METVKLNNGIEMPLLGFGVFKLLTLKKQAMNLQKAIDYLDFKVTHFDDQLLTYENEKLAYEGKAKKDLQN